MKRLIGIFVCLVLSLSAIPKSNAADLVVLTKNGATISFVSPIYTVIGTSTIYADYSNQTGYGILIFGYELTDKFGTSLADGSSISVPNGTSGRMSAYWNEYSISRGVAPFTLTLKIVYNAVHNKPDDYHSVPFTFVSRTAVTPTPTPSATPTPTPSATPTPAVTVKPLEVPDLSPTTTLRWQDTMLYARVQVPAGIKNRLIPIDGIKARLFFGTVAISNRDSIQPITINAAYEVNFTWELSSVWKSLMLAEWPMRVETEFYNSAGSGVKQISEIAVPKISATPTPEAQVTAKKVTITCIKGKLTKKVTAVKPKCPTGYKVKK